MHRSVIVFALSADVARQIVDSVLAEFYISPILIFCSFTYLSSMDENKLMAQHTITSIATIGIICLAINPIVVADSIEAPIKRELAPADHIVSQPAIEHEPKIKSIGARALAENNDVEEVSRWSEIWE